MLVFRPVSYSLDNIRCSLLIVRPPPKIQTLPAENEYLLDEYGFFVDEPIPELMEVDEFPTNEGQRNSEEGKLFAFCVRYFTSFLLILKCDL